MKNLLIASNEIFFHHGSGEDETKIIQIGFELGGVHTSQPGLDHGNFIDYDFYCAFSVRDDVIKMIKKIPLSKPCFLFPMIEDYDFFYEKIETLRSQKNIYLIARTHQELTLFSRFVGKDKSLLMPAWFLVPFISKASVGASPIAIENKKYGLAMIGSDRAGGVRRYCEKMRTLNADVVIYCDNIEATSDYLRDYENVICRSRCDYGTEEWYRSISNCMNFYEPNARLTSSVLECLWNGKLVFSDKFNDINKYFNGVNLILDLEKLHSLEMESNLVRNCKEEIYKFHANFQIDKIVDRVKKG